MTQPLLRVRDLAVEIGSPGAATRVVDGVGFDLEAGGCLGIVGEFGFGQDA